VLMAC